MTPTQRHRRMPAIAASAALAAALTAPLAAQELEPFDADADGTLDAGELRAAFAARGVAAGLDLDGDALLDPAELADALHGLWDADDDGTLSVGEWDDGVDRWFGEDPVNLAVGVWDRDGDGTVSEAELAAALEETEIFAGLDADADGLLGDDELAGVATPTDGEEGLALGDDDGLLIDMAELLFASDDEGAAEGDGGEIDPEPLEEDPLEDEPPLIERGEPFVQLPIPCDGACGATAARFCEALGYEPPLGTLAVGGSLYVIRCADET